MKTRFASLARTARTAGKRLLTILLVLSMLFALCACGDADTSPGTADGNTGNSASDSKESRSGTIDTSGGDTDGGGADKIKDNYALPDDYTSGYDFYTRIADKLTALVTDTIDANNKRLEEADPNAFFNSDQYMLLLFLPYNSLGMAMTSGFGKDATVSTIKSTYSILGGDGVQVTQNANGGFIIAYQSEDYLTKEKQDIVEIIDYSNGSIRYETTTNGVTQAFYEFVSLGNDRFAMQSRTHRSILTYKNGEITELTHSYTVYEEDWETGELSPQSKFYDSTADSIWGRKELDESWVLEHQAQDALERIFKVKDGVMTVEGVKINTNWDTGESTYTPMEPIEMPLP